MYIVYLITPHHLPVMRMVGKAGRIKLPYGATTYDGVNITIKTL